MHSLWLSLSLTTFCNLLLSNEAAPSNAILLWLEATRSILGPAKKAKTLDMTTTPLPIQTNIETEQTDLASEDELNKVRRCNQHDKITAAACGCLFSMVHSSVLISWITNIGVWNHYWYYCYNTTNQYLATQKIITFMQQVTIALVQTFCGALRFFCKFLEKWNWKQNIGSLLISN